MSKSLTTTDSPRRTRPLKPPTERDLHIYKFVKIQLREHSEVAQDHQIDKSRVSQIIKRVNRWLAAGGDPSDPVLRDYAARQRLSTGMLKLRLVRAVEMASYALEFPQPPATTKKRYHGITEVWREEITHDAPKVNLAALRVLLDASKAIQKLDDGRNTPLPSQPHSDDEVLHLVSDLLLDLRHRAESQGRLSPAQDHRAAISAALATVLGPAQMNSTAGTLNSPPSPLTSPLPNPSPDAPNRSLMSPVERETQDTNSPTTLPEKTCDNAPQARSSEVSASCPA